MSPDVLAIVQATRTVEVEFSDWWVPFGGDDGTLCGHIQVADRAAVTRLIEVLLDLGAGIDVDVGPSTADIGGRWSVWVRSRRRRATEESRE